MRRGEVWTLAGGGDFVGKPRPVVIIQDDRFELASVTVCPLTTNPAEADLFRVELQPTLVNGLDATSRVMADKFTTVRRLRLTNRIGELTGGDLRRLERAVLVFLGFAGVSRPARGETANEDDT